jgi:predicted outer membrane repeat protein
MEGHIFDQFVRQVIGGQTRRGLLRLFVSLPLGAWLDHGNAAAKKKRKKRKKRKRKKTCGRVGGKPVKGKCCGRSVNVDGQCRNCDVCASGCAFAAVQEAIDAAVDGATIAICPGTYVERLIISKDLTLVGAGDGDGLGSTIVQGSGQGSVIQANLRQIVLQHLRITGGGGDGAGIFNESATLDLIGCTVSENLAPGFLGGGIQNTGTLTLTGSVVRENRAGGGGGIWNTGNGTLNLIASEISGNTAELGGGINNRDGATVVFDARSRVTGNTATEDGGGIYNLAGGTLTLVSSANVAGNDPNNCGGADVPLSCIG